MPESPSAQRSLGLRADPEVSQKLSVILDAVSRMPGGPQEEIDEAKEQLDAGKPELALLLLERVKKQRWATITDLHRSRWCTLAANARMRMGDEVAVAALLEEAFEYTPDDERTAANLVKARLFKNGRAAARSTAAEQLKRFPLSGHLHGASIELADSIEEARAAIAAVPDTLADDLQVLLAIAFREDMISTSEAAARKALDLCPSSGPAWLALGALIFASEMQDHGSAASVLEPPHPSRLQESRRALDEALARAITASNKPLQLAALVGRARCHLVLGLIDEANRDAEEALRLSPLDAPALLMASHVASDRGDHAASVSFLQRIGSTERTSEVLFFLGIALWNRNDVGDRAEAVPCLVQVARAMGPHAEEAAILAVDGAVARGTRRRPQQPNCWRNCAGTWTLAWV